MKNQKSLKTWFSNLNLLNKSLLVVLSMQLLCSLVTSSLYYDYSAKSITAVHAESMNKDINLIKGYLESQMNQMNNIAYGVGTNQSLAISVISYIHSPTTKKYIELTSTLMDKLIEIRTSNKDLILSAVYIVEDQLFYDYLNILRPGIDMKAMLKTISEPTYAFPLILEAQENPFFKDKGKVIPLVYRYRMENENTYLIILLDVQKIQKKLSEYSNAGELILFDGLDRSIFDQKLDRADIHQLHAVEPTTSSYTEVKIQDKKYIATLAVMEQSSWKIFSLKDEAAVLAKIKNLLIYIFLVFLVVYIFEGVVLYFIYRSITRPINKLANLMENQTPGTFIEQFHYPYDNEIGRLSKAYGRMMQEILAEEKQVAWEQKQKRLAEIKALQAQINPHFLYNTLNSISWLAIDQNDEKPASLANLLASYYRTSLSKGQEFISIKTECEHVLYYLKIQEIRYKDLLTFSFDIPEKFSDYSVVKIILQPLVENAIYHGIKPKAMPGHIAISLKKKDEATLEFSIEDNGLGINEEKLSAINKNLHDGVFHSETGYGIYNVNARIRLTYGLEYGLTLESIENVKTISRVTVPIHHTREDSEE